MSRTKREPTQTGGRSATTRTVMGEYALAVGLPKAIAPSGWTWSKLTDIARLESGHTPSRRKPEYWGGDVPWIGIKDARGHHGEEIDDTLQHTNELGLANSSARLLPAKTVCLSRTASVGYVIVMGREMATSQDFVNWICSDKLDHEYLKYLLIAEKPAYRKFSSGAVHQTIYFPEVKALHICHPEVAEQKRIVSILDEPFSAIAKAKENAEKNLANARELFESYLNRVFTQQGPCWQERTLGDLCETTQGVQIPKSRQFTEHRNGLMRYLYISDFMYDKNLKFVEDNNPAKRVTADDLIVVNTGATAGKIFRGIDGVLSNNLFKVTLNRELIDADFLYYFVSSRTFKHHQARIVKGAANPHMGHGNFKSTPIKVPRLEIQRASVAAMDDVSVESRRLETIYTQKLANLDELKQSLLQKAFTGQLTARELAST